MRAVIRPVGPPQRMTTGAERGGIRLTFLGSPGPSSKLTPFDGDAYTRQIAVAFPIVPQEGDRVSHLGCSLEQGS